MKKILVFAIEVGLLSQLVSCNSTSLSVKVDSSAQSIATKSFVQWCQQKESVPPATKLTIDLLLKEAGSNDCQLADTKLRSLTSLDLYYSKITDVTPLAGLSNLTSLDLIGNQISDITPLVGLSKLTFLSLSKNQIVDIKPLTRLNHLTFLGLGKNKIIDIKPLAGLDNLLTLSLEDNPISEQICPMKSTNICSF